MCGTRAVIEDSGHLEGGGGPSGPTLEWHRGRRTYPSKLHTRTFVIKKTFPSFFLSSVTRHTPPTNGNFQQHQPQRPQSYNTQPQHQQQQPQDRASSYNPNTYGPVSSPPAHQQYFSPPPGQQYSNAQQPSTTQYGQQQQQAPQQQYNGGLNVPAGWHPPPPPPGPPPSQDYGALSGSQYPAGPGGYATDPRRTAAQQMSGGGDSGEDPWAGLSAWK
ncbi:bck1-like resistance to osmotic shock [Friedmanniomyces endolithicus]|nr:bck1-like resistance to osmotic shock [Friedmanniomyces endolithicus]